MKFFRLHKKCNRKAFLQEVEIYILDCIIKAILDGKEMAIVPMDRSFKEDLILFRDLTIKLKEHGYAVHGEYDWNTITSIYENGLKISWENR